VTRQVRTVDMLEAARQLFSDTSAANFILVGIAYQSGWLPIPAAAIETAIKLNGVSVESNVRAFRWGRVAVADPEVFARATVRSSRGHRRPALTDSLDLWIETLEAEVGNLVRRRAEELVLFQGVRASAAYVDLVVRASAAEAAFTSKTHFAEAVARNLFKLMAYKDEYEVARLLTDAEFVADLTAEFPAGSKVSYKLHPPVLRAIGRRSKISFGPRSHVVLRVLARGKFLRGTRFDPFGYAHVRRVERALVRNYVDFVQHEVETLSPESYTHAVRVALLPDQVRGYEQVKLGSVKRYVSELQSLGVPTDDLRKLLGADIPHAGGKPR
jgi:indolepyruvate ferredoxin oxidoreductase